MDDKKLPTDEVLYGIPMQDYLDDPATGSSTLSYILKSPADFQYARNSTFNETLSLFLGTVIHSRILEADTFDDLYIYEPEGMERRTKKGKEAAEEFIEKADGKIVIPYKMKDTVDKAVKAVEYNEEIAEILSVGNAEVTAVTEVMKHVVDGGIRIKTREDWIDDDGFIWDLKTTVQPMDNDSIARTILKYNYHFKAAHHLDVMRRTGADIKGFGWIFVSTAPNGAPHAVATRMPDRMWELANEQHYDALMLLSECMKTGNYYGYGQKIEEIDLPEWAYKKRLYSEDI